MLFYAMVFGLGAALYPALELLWRGRTHWLMGLAGGLSLCGLGMIAHHLSHVPLGLRGILGGLWITCIELIIGLVGNRDYHIWDYRSCAVHWEGQVCLPYAALWCFISIACMKPLALLADTFYGKTFT